MKNILIAAVILLTGLAGYAQKTTVSASIVAAKRNHKSKSIDFNVWCGNQPWRGLVINDGMTAMDLFICIRQKSKLYWSLGWSRI
jgi:hypothetical protein